MDQTTTTNERDLLTNSRAKAARACLRLEQIEYRLLYRPATDADALRIGTLVHQALEAWWWCRFPADKGVEAFARLPEDSRLRAVLMALPVTPERGPWDPALSLEAALARIEAEPRYSDHERAYCRALLRGYDARWAGEPWETEAVELQFRTRLINPATKQPSQTWDLGGKLDLLLRHAETREVWFGEHKTAGTDISVGATYWKRLRMDSQVSTYYDGAASLGYDVAGCLYDVLYKPRTQPAKATPEAERETTIPKYKACPECKRKGAAPGPHQVDGMTCGVGTVVTLPDGRELAVPGEAGKLLSDPPRYKANVRCADETPAEYEARVLEAVTGERLLSSYVREPIPRIGNQLDEYRIDLWNLARMMREQELAGRFPRNPSACERWGKFCPYFEVCVGSASLDDPTLFRRANEAHEELAPEEP